MWVPVAVMAGLPANCYTLLYFYFTNCPLYIHVFVSRHFSTFRRQCRPRLLETMPSLMMKRRDETTRNKHTWTQIIRCKGRLGRLVERGSTGPWERARHAHRGRRRRSRLGRRCQALDACRSAATDGHNMRRRSQWETGDSLCVVLRRRCCSQHVR